MFVCIKIPKKISPNSAIFSVSLSLLCRIDEGVNIVSDFLLNWVAGW